MTQGATEVPTPNIPGNPTEFLTEYPMQTPAETTSETTGETVVQARLRGLYVITDARLGGGHLAMARAALDGGAKILQLRDKGTPRREILAIARQLRFWTRQNDAILLINDSLDLALLCEADGVHLGPDDWPISDARRVLGAQKIIGASTGTPDEARAAQRAGATYLGAGAVFGTQTKTDAGAPIGLDGLRAIALATSLPVAAIGGVGAGNIAATFAQGARMACVISALTSETIPSNFNSIGAATEKTTAAESVTNTNKIAMTRAASELVALSDAALARRNR